MPEFQDLSVTLGPIGALFAWMWWTDRQRAAPAAKPDPAADLAAEIRKISDMLIRIETLLEKK